MCRLLALPPGSTPSEAYKAIATLEGCNKDGVGVGYWREDGTASVTKYPEALTEVLRLKRPLFEHMPFNGWTIAHTRLATHGKATHENTHPFGIGDYIFAHNGIFREAHYIRMALNKYKVFKGETDSEVVGWMMNNYGPEYVKEHMSYGAGVFMGLHKSGELHIVKTSGDLEFASIDEDDEVIKPKGKVVIASEIQWDYNSRRRDGDSGLYILNPDGTIKSHPGSTPCWDANNNNGYLHGYGGYGCRNTTTRTEAEIKKDLFMPSSYEQDKKNEPPPERRLGLWTLDPDLYLVDMLGAR